jgi:hypothetical protein
LTSGSLLEDFTLEFYTRHRKEIKAIDSPETLFGSKTLQAQFAREWTLFAPQAGPLSADMMVFPLARLARFRWGNNEYYRTINRHDPVVESARTKLSR